MTILEIALVALVVVQTLNLLVMAIQTRVMLAQTRQMTDVAIDGNALHAQQVQMEVEAERARLRAQQDWDRQIRAQQPPDLQVADVVPLDRGEPERTDR